MGLFGRKHDPIAERERALNERIAELEGQIKGLHERIEQDQAQPKLRSTARPHAQPVPPAPAGASDPAFEEVNHQRVKAPATPETAPGHFNELGVRKYDLLASLRRWFDHWRGEPTPNPKLVSFLAAGSIHGLRPLRYEKRVARNRFLALCVLLIAILWGAIYFYLRNR